MPYSRNRATARSQEHPPTDVGEDPTNDDELPPVDYGVHQDWPLHLGDPSSSHVDNPPYHADNTLHSSSVDPSALECILERQQQQLTTALATQQQTMMASFQQMFTNILTSHATAANTAPAGNHNTNDYSQSKMRLNDPDPFDGYQRTQRALSIPVSTFSWPNLNCTRMRNPRYASHCLFSNLALSSGVTAYSVTSKTACML